LQESKASLIPEYDSEWKNVTLLKEPRNAWATSQRMEKSRTHLELRTTISRRNQITIPLRLMHEFDLRAGDKIKFSWITKTGQDRTRLIGEVSREGRQILRVLIRISPSRKPSLEEVAALRRQQRLDGGSNDAAFTTLPNITGKR
jgi:bifunctional DNA-binding transcriptional regulator/antitoxin component of YhaV-PrlF toxin-antitoxin module